VGFAALIANTGHDNTASGFLALQANTIGGFNTANGSYTLTSNTTGGHNTASGYHALRFNTTGGNNTASGAFELGANTSGRDNTASGAAALSNNTVGVENTASGQAALFANTTGNDNTASGFLALQGNSSGGFNTASGAFALHLNSTGIKNTAVGSSALLNSTGDRNIAIGFQAGTNLLSGNHNIYLGNHGGDSTEFQTIRLGEVQTSTYIAGINTAGVSGTAVVVDANGQLGITLSSARYKQDIAPMGTRSERVLDLRPVTFAYKDDTHQVTHYGLIAEEVATVLPELVTHTATGEVQTVKYQELIPMLLNELQRQRQAFQQESAEVAMLRKELAELRAVVGSR
jgi:hypothetical protein